MITKRSIKKKKTPQTAWGYRQAHVALFLVTCQPVAGSVRGFFLPEACEDGYVGTLDLPRGRQIGCSVVPARVVCFVNIDSDLTLKTSAHHPKKRGL